VACGGTVGTSGSSSSPTLAGATPAATTATGSPATAQPTQSSTASGQSQLGEILASARLTTYKIGYRYTIAGQATDQTWYSKPPRQRFDFSVGTGASALVISFFALPEGSYSCFSVGTSKQCMAVPGAGSPLDQNAVASSMRAMIQNPGSVAGTFVETKTFAGQTGLCYDVTGTTSGRFCYTRDGILLYSAFSAAGSAITMEATQVTTTVPDSDFELPAKP
jgi:hypothetical protein